MTCISERLIVRQIQYLSKTKGVEKQPFWNSWQQNPPSNVHASVCTIADADGFVGLYNVRLFTLTVWFVNLLCFTSIKYSNKTE